MSNILCLETSSRNCSVAIFSNDELLCLCEEEHEHYRHNEWLHTFIEWALEGADLELAQIQAVAVSSGPGSYTGLRIGVSAAKGLAFGLDIPLIAIPTLDILLQPHLQNKSYSTLVASIDARRMDVYLKAINLKDRKELMNGFFSIDNTTLLQFHSKVLVVGDAAEKISSTYSEFDAIVSLPSAQFMGVIAASKFQSHQFESVAYFEPQYFKDVFITQPKNSWNASK